MKMRIKTALFYGFLILAGMWVTGFLWFVSQVNCPPEDMQTRTDAIIALTGGTERLATAAELLKEEKADKMLISGVDRKVDWMLLAETIHELPDTLADRITLGHVACNTRDNALETRDWMERNGFKTIRLVTASYHMPRSLSEFKNVMPDIVIIPHPIFPQTVKHKEWWKWPGTFALILSEYTKFLVVSIRHILPFIPNNTTFNAEQVCTK